MFTDAQVKVITDHLVTLIDKANGHAIGTDSDANKWHEEVSFTNDEIGKITVSIKIN